MAKRHTDTIQFDQQWFQILHPTYKCFWFYICAKCNHAGIWDVNLPLARFSIDPKGETGVEFDKLLEIFNGRIIDLGKDKWYLPKYVLFHHGEILYPNNNFHISIIKSLEKHQLIDEDINGNYIVRMSPNSSSKATPSANTAAKRFKSPDIEECIDYFREKKFKNAKHEAEKFWNFYESKGWMVGKNNMKNWHSAATNWNKSNETDKKKKSSRAHVQEGHLEEDHGW